MEPKGDKKPTLNPYRFCVTLLITFGIILAPKVLLFEPYFGSKTDLFPKVVILSKYCTGHTDSRFGPLKMIKFVSKIVLFADMVPGPVLGHLFIAFGAHSGSFFGTKMLQK